MSYLPIDQGYAQEREVRRLARLLEPATKSADAQAMGHLLAARLWSIDNCKDGSLPVADGWILEEAALWRGPEGELIKAFCEIGFLRRDGETLYFPDWQERQGRVLAERKRWRDSKAAKRTPKGGKGPSGGESTESPAGIPGESLDIVTNDNDLTNDSDESDKRETPPLSHTAIKEAERQAALPLEESAQVLERFPGWTSNMVATRLLLARLAAEHPGVDLVYQVRAFVSHMLENGPPDNCEAALRGWMNKARAA